MTWTLIILLFGYSGAPSIDASMKFVDQASCELAKPAVAVAVDGGYKPARLTCVDTIGRE